jgi:hypothetical protein
MARVKQSELEHLAEMINTRLGIVDPDAKYEIHRAYGSPRLERELGSVDVSPRLPAGQLADWMRAYLAGIDTGKIEPTGEALLAARLVGALDDLRAALDDDAESGPVLLFAAQAVLDAAKGSPVESPRVEPPANMVVGWRICGGCHESYNPDDAELHERCSE